MKNPVCKRSRDFSLLRRSFRLLYHARAPAGFFSMPKDGKLKQQQMRMLIAAAAARIMAEDGIEDFALAKRKAARQLGAEDTQALPRNEEIEAELRAYQSLYQGEEQRERIQYLRERALDAMRLLSQFRPYLAGPVLKGTAGRYSEIDLQLFTDDCKAVELFLVNRDIPYDISDQRCFAGDQTRAVSVLRVEWRDVPINLAIYSLNDERGKLKTSFAGRPMERAGIQAVSLLLSRQAS
ncbi:MAG TPA: UDP-N-acetylmuramate--alanine ligase [Burkholderiales bacterium]|nr:UDP-N-acetylmuramate--alanine ligase [Burkholderiales bacterium]